MFVFNAGKFCGLCRRQERSSYKIEEQRQMNLVAVFTIQRKIHKHTARLNTHINERKMRHWTNTKDTGDDASDGVYWIEHWIECQKTGICINLVLFGSHVKRMPLALWLLNLWSFFTLQPVVSHSWRLGIMFGCWCWCWYVIYKLSAENWIKIVRPPDFKLRTNNKLE